MSPLATPMVKSSLLWLGLPIAVSCFREYYDEKTQTRICKHWQLYLHAILSIRWYNTAQWRTQKIFMGGFNRWHVVVICIWCALFVTSQFGAIVMSTNQRFGEFFWHNIGYVYWSTRTPLNLCVIELNINHLRSRLVYRRKIHSTLRHSSS